MKTLDSIDRTSFAVRSINTLLEIITLLDGDVDKRRGVDFYFEGARSVKYLFDHLAWVDRTLDERECAMLDSLLSVDPRLAKAYSTAVAAGPSMEGIVVIPFLLDLAHDYDERNGTCLGHMTINALEMIGYGIISADGELLLKEIEAFQLHLSKLREYLSRLPRQTG